MSTPTATAKPYSINPRTALEMVRTNTCYGGLRFVINIATWLIVLAACAALVVAVVTAAGGKSDIMGAAAIAAIAAIAIPSAFLLRDVSRILIDIADTLIATYSCGPR